jgi:hypothetical protein
LHDTVLCLLSQLQLQLAHSICLAFHTTTLQVLIRSCFTLLSRETCEGSGFRIDDEDEELFHAISPKPVRPAPVAPAVTREPPPLSADEISYFTRTGLMTPAHHQQQLLQQQQEDLDAEKENDEDDYYYSDDPDHHQQSHSTGAVCELLDTVHSAREMVQQHNALIVRVAAEAGVSMTGQEWNEFFSAPLAAPAAAAACDTASYQHSSQSPFAAAPAAAATSASSTSEKAARAAALAAVRAADPLGTLSEDELCAFRTQPCLLGEPHPADKCDNSHSSELGASAWLRRDPRELRYQPRRCADSVAHGPRGCRLGVACSLSHSEEEVRFHPLVYKTRLCPQGLACELRRYCPYLHTRQQQQQQQQSGAPVRPTRAAVAQCVDINTTATAGEDGGSGTAAGYGTSPPAANPTAAAAVNWDAVSTLGGCKPAAAAFGSSSFAGEVAGGYGGISGMSGTGRLWVDRRRIVGVPALLAALRKRSADLLRPPVRHNAMMQEVSLLAITQ